jgi:hypothetical protein
LIFLVKNSSIVTFRKQGKFGSGDKLGSKGMGEDFSGAFLATRFSFEMGGNQEEGLGMQPIVVGGDRRKMIGGRRRGIYFLSLSAC